MHTQGEAVPFHGTFSRHVENRELGGESEQWFWLTPKFFYWILMRLAITDYCLSLRLTTTLLFSTVRVRVTSELERPWANSARCLPWMPEYLKACW